MHRFAWRHRLKQDSKQYYTMCNVVFSIPKLHGVQFIHPRWQFVIDLCPLQIGDVFIFKH